MPPAARVGDLTDHPGVVSGPGVPTVLIGGMPAATLTTMHACSFPSPVTPHPPTPLAGPGSTSVLVGGLPAARVGDRAGCGAMIIVGCPTVVIGG